MVATDIIGCVQTIAETRGRGWLAGSMDVIGWLVGITTLTISVTSLQGHDFARKALVVVLVSAANLFGTKLGQMIGQRFVKDKSVEERLAAIEAHVYGKR